MRPLGGKASRRECGAIAPGAQRLIAIILRAENREGKVNSEIRICKINEKLAGIGGSGGPAGRSLRGSVDFGGAGDVKAGGDVEGRGDVAGRHVPRDGGCRPAMRAVTRRVRLPKVAISSADGPSSRAPPVPCDGPQLHLSFLGPSGLARLEYDFTAPAPLAGVPAAGEPAAGEPAAGAGEPVVPPPPWSQPIAWTENTMTTSPRTRRFITMSLWLGRRGEKSGMGRWAVREGTASRPAPPQYESELMTSPRLRLPRAHHVFGATVFLMKWTEPSAKPTFTPPGWLLPGGALPSGVT
jgi:hypothetical protein